MAVTASTIAKELKKDLTLAKELQTYINGLNLQTSNRFDGKSMYETPAICLELEQIKDYVAKFAIKDRMVQQYYSRTFAEQGHDVAKRFEMLKSIALPSHIDKYSTETILVQIKEHVFWAYVEEFMGEIKELKEQIRQQLLMKLHLEQGSDQDNAMFDFISKYVFIYTGVTIGKTLRFGNCGNQVGILLEYLLKKSKDSGDFNVFLNKNFYSIAIFGVNSSMSKHQFLVINDKICFDPWQNKIFEKKDLAKNVPVGYRSDHIEGVPGQCFLASDSPFKKLPVKILRTIMDEVCTTCDNVMGSFVQNADVIVSSIMKDVDEDIKFQAEKLSQPAQTVQVPQAAQQELSPAPTVILSQIAPPKKLAQNLAKMSLKKG